SRSAGLRILRFLPTESSAYSLSPAQPHNISQRCVGQWWRIIGRSSALASVYLQKTFVRGFFQQNIDKKNKLVIFHSRL
ncbi:hypothetical protein, partial [Photorhabdus heterorhabditis]|uniref:hypothetical protein n=1 Tax=Photorhabdus heterorhabditis TaxID=880156 RepID=UPI001C25662A